MPPEGIREMPYITDETAATLRNLGVLDPDLKVTSEAYAGPVARSNVFGQARILKLPLICLRPQSGQSPERQVVRFCKSTTKASVDTGEGYWIKSFIGCLVPFFDYRKRKVSLDENNLTPYLEAIDDITESDIVRLIEIKEIKQSLGDNFWRVFPQEISQTNNISATFLRERFMQTSINKPDHIITEEEWRKAKVEAFSRRWKKYYVDSILGYLKLWRCLPRSTWITFIERVIGDWEKLYTGWPDVTVIDKNGFVTLIEVKGSDKVHASQVYTLLELRNILGRGSVCLAWVNRNTITIQNDLYLDHLRQAREFISSPPKKRKDPHIPDWVEY